jgi:hypothetical protein
MKHKYEKPRSIDLGEYNSLKLAGGRCGTGTVAQGMPNTGDCLSGSIAEGTACYNGDYQSSSATGCGAGNAPQNWQCIDGKYN